MSDAWVEIHHPDGRDGYVTQFAFDVLWSKKGWKLGRRDEADEEHVAAPAPADPEPAVDEVEELRARLAAKGVKVDKRWGLKRLRAEDATLTDGDDE